MDADAGLTVSDQDLCQAMWERRFAKPDFDRLDWTAERDWRRGGGWQRCWGRSAWKAARVQRGNRHPGHLLLQGQAPMTKRHFLHRQERKETKVLADR